MNDTHIHHYVPTPTGKRWNGEPVQVMQCECGANMPKVTTNSDRYQ